MQFHLAMADNLLELSVLLVGNSHDAETASQPNIGLCLDNNDWMQQSMNDRFALSQ